MWFIKLIPEDTQTTVQYLKVRHIGKEIRHKTAWLRISTYLRLRHSYFWVMMTNRTTPRRKCIMQNHNSSAFWKFKLQHSVTVSLKFTKIVCSYWRWDRENFGPLTLSQKCYRVVSQNSSSKQSSFHSVHVPWGFSSFYSKAVWN